MTGTGGTQLAICSATILGQAPHFEAVDELDESRRCFVNGMGGALLRRRPAIGEGSSTNGAGASSSPLGLRPAIERCTWHTYAMMARYTHFEVTDDRDECCRCFVNGTGSALLRRRPAIGEGSSTCAPHTVAMMAYDILTSRSPMIETSAAAVSSTARWATCCAGGQPSAKAAALARLDFVIRLP
ncbi:hypothetical protein DIPPA_04303 [Diplonema papillatum]|nr:hypothetical protein DIPPA_04303 [Diplonema papillatum]